MEPKDQIEKLGKFILEEIPGEPASDYGAIECAITVMREQKKKIAALELEIESLKRTIELSSKDWGPC